MSMGIKQIAKLANVSIGTVDRVLHKRPGVSKDTERKVLKIIEEFGYIPNTTASRLKLASIKKINYAILIPVTKHKWNYWKLPKKGISQALDELKELGVTADFYEFSNSTTFIDQSKIIIQKNYDAMVTVPFFQNESNDLLDYAKKKKIPVVFLDTEISLNQKSYFICQNSHKAGMVAGRLLHGLIGAHGDYFVVNIINEKGIHANNIQRENGFKAFFKSIGENVKIHTINYTLSNEFEVTAEMENWFKTENPKGIFVTNSKAHLLPEILRQYSIVNTHIVGFDLNKQNLKYLENNEIHFLINQQPKFQGYSAIKGLFQYLTKQDDSSLNIDIPIEIIVKENITSQ